MYTFNRRRFALFADIIALLGLRACAPVAIAQTPTPLNQSVATGYPIGAAGTFTAVVNSGKQPSGNIPVWGSSCTCVTLVPAVDGMSATFKVTTAATVGQSVTISVVAPTYPDGTPGAAGQVSFTILPSPDPSAYTIIQTAGLYDFFIAQSTASS